MHFAEVMKRLRLEALKRDWISRAFYHVEEEFVLYIVRESDNKEFKIEFEQDDLYRKHEELHEDLHNNLNLLQPE